MLELESLCNLLFELSNEDRLRILIQLEREPMNVTKLSKELSLSIQECSRHVSRLDEVGLTKKDVDGNLHLTPYGELSLRQLQGQMFTAKHREYFTSHTLARLPSEFVDRIGELADSTYIDHVMVAVHNVEKTLREAEEYLCDINVPYIASAFTLIRAAFERGVKSRFIHTKDLVVPPSMREAHTRAWTDQTITRFTVSGVYEEKVMDKADLVLYMSEKEVTILAFPLQDGSFDFLGFTSKDQRAHKWCHDTFEYYWERAKRSID